jgi:hypothetical protein
MTYERLFPVDSLFPCFISLFSGIGKSVKIWRESATSGSVFRWNREISLVFPC